jgi:hypothetical protein
MINETGLKRSQDEDHECCFSDFLRKDSIFVGNLGSSLDNRLCVVSEERKNHGFSLLGVFDLNLFDFVKLVLGDFSCTTGTISKECGTSWD